MNSGNYWNELPLRFRVALFIGTISTSITVAYLTKPFLPAEWSGWSIGVVCALAVLMLSKAPASSLGVTAALIVGSSFQSWKTRLDPSPFNISILLAIFAAGAFWVMHARRQFGAVSQD